MTTICGTKCSACCAFFSLWGFIMLGLCGLFFYVQAPTLSPDIPIDQDTFAKDNYNYTYITGLYKQNAYNCWITALIYLVIFILCSIRFYVNLMRVKERRAKEA